MEGKSLARFIAILFLAIAMTAALIRIERGGELPEPPGAEVVVPPEDPLRGSLRRCQQMGKAAANDKSCLDVWAETRDRFLGHAPDIVTPQENGRR